VRVSYREERRAFLANVLSASAACSQTAAGREPAGGGVAVKSGRSADTAGERPWRLREAGSEAGEPSNSDARKSSTPAPPVSAMAMRDAAAPSRAAACQMGSSVALVSEDAFRYLLYASRGDPAIRQRSADSFSRRAACLFLLASASFAVPPSLASPAPSIGVSSGADLRERLRPTEDATARDREGGASSESFRLMRDSCWRKMATAMSFTTTGRCTSIMAKEDEEEGAEEGGKTTSSVPSSWAAGEARSSGEDAAASSKELNTNSRRRTEPGSGLAAARSRDAQVLDM
jgi:hypothetical protein